MPSEENSMLHEQIAAAPPQNLARQAQERSFHSHDGTEIFYRFWPATSAETKGAVVLFHRGHEHGGRMAHLVDELHMPDYAFYAWDARGNGRSAGERGYAHLCATSPVSCARSPPGTALMHKISRS
jgi:alpha-beta hydrolase superfamily lysophospholipase